MKQSESANFQSAAVSQSEFVRSVAGSEPLTTSSENATVGEVLIEVGRLEIKTEANGCCRILIDGVEVNDVTKISLSCDFSERFWRVNFEKIVDSRL